MIPPPRRLTRWAFDDVAPAISPDGKRVAFYSSFRPADARRREGWALLTIAADGTDAPSGAALIDRVLLPTCSNHLGTPPAW